MAMEMRNIGFAPAKIRAEAMKRLGADEQYKKQVEKNTLEYKRAVRELIEEIKRKAAETGNEIVANAGTMSWIDDMRVWEAAGKTITDNSFLEQLQQAIGRQTAATMENLTGTAGFKTMNGYESVENLYRREMDKAAIKICTGTFSQQKVMDDVIHSLSQSGLRSIDFSSGYSMQLDTAAKNAVRTGCAQIAAKIQDRNIMDTGENLVYVSEHEGARNTGSGVDNHEEWQGKVYYIKAGFDYEKEARRVGQESITDIWQATGYSPDGSHENNPLGLYGYGCRHKHYVWFEGVSQLPDKSPKAGPFVVNGRKYDYYAMTQRLRFMERNIRALKREKLVQDRLGIDSKQTAAKIGKKLSEYHYFCKTCKIPDNTTNIMVDSGSSNLNKTRAYKTYQREYFRNMAPDNLSGAAGDGTEPVCIGQINIEETGAAVQYFGDQIRDSETEKLYIIDKNGNVYYNEGDESFVGTGELDLRDCILLHNHPAEKNGIVSFGGDDFRIMRDCQPEASYLVNEQYNYHAKCIKSMKDITYNQAWRWAVEDFGEKLYSEDMQHLIMESLAKRGYIRYERNETDGGTEK